jgi:hypothetical protein
MCQVMIVDSCNEDATKGASEVAKIVFNSVVQKYEGRWITIFQKQFEIDTELKYLFPITVAAITTLQHQQLVALQVYQVRTKEFGDWMNKIQLHSMRSCSLTDDRTFLKFFLNYATAHEIETILGLGTLGTSRFDSPHEVRTVSHVRGLHLFMRP